MFEFEVGMAVSLNPAHRTNQSYPRRKALLGRTFTIVSPGVHSRWRIALTGVEVHRTQFPTNNGPPFDFAVEEDEIEPAGGPW